MSDLSEFFVFNNFTAILLINRIHWSMKIIFCRYSLRKCILRVSIVSFFITAYWFMGNELVSHPLLKSRVVKHDPNAACVIPLLDPYDPVIRHHLKPQVIEECPLNYKVKVWRDRLFLHAENVNDVGFRYIRRETDFEIKMSDWNSMVEFKKVAMTPGKVNS